MRRLIPILAFLALLSSKQSEVEGQTVYLRDSAPAAAPVCGATNATPVVVRTCSPHGLNVGDFVGLFGVATGTGVSPVNGVRKVIASSSNDSTHFAIGSITGTPIAGTGAWFDGTSTAPGGFPGGAQWAGKLTAYTLGAQPLGWLDGPTGAHMRKLSMGTANGLTSLTVTSNVATVTTSYNHLLTSGDKIGIWGSGVSALDNGHNPYTVTVTGPQTFTFPTPGVSNGTKTGVNNACGPAPTPNDTIGGTADCLRISQLAYTGNPTWDGLEISLTITNMNNDPGYKHVFHGGLVISGFQAPGWYANAALKFLVDQSNAQMFKAGMYDFNNPEFQSSVNWIGNEFFGSAGNTDTSDFLSHNMNGFAMVYSVFAPYASAAHKTTTLNKLYNDVDDPTIAPCSRAHGDVGTHNRVLASDVAQGGSSNTIILSAADTQNDNFYVNNVVLGSFGQFALITGYVKATKVATISGSWVGPAAGQAYTIYATVTVASNAANGTTTMTGYNTHFTTDITVGDAIEGENFWDQEPDSSASYVSAINSDTSLTVINSWHPATSTTIPSLVWFFPKWAPGDCGMFHRNKYWVGSFGSQPAVYPTGGTLTAAIPGGAVPTLATDGGNNTATWAASHVVLDLATAADDPRAIRDLAWAQSFGFDYELRHYMNYGSPMHSGSAYTYANTMRGVHQFAEQLAISIPTYPSMDLTGPWVMNASISKMFMVYPDNDGGVTEITRYGTETNNNTSTYSGRYLTVTGVTLDPVFNWAPTSSNARYFRNFLERVQPYSLWGYQGVTDDYQYLDVIHNDPRVVSSDYTVQPTQYAFKANSSARCASLTGWPCPPLFRGDVVVSRTSWTDKAATSMYYGSRTWWGDHDNPENGTLRIYKVGELVMTDYYPPGGQAASGNPDQTSMGDMIQFGGAASMVGGIFTQTAGITPITRWASGNHGTWDPAYGDQNSRYAYVCSDLSGVYLTPMNHALRCVSHFKKAGTDEFIVQHDDVDVTGHPIAIETHIHYNQNGEAATPFTYSEGDTTCPGSGGCLSLNTNRAVQSLEDGGTNGVTPRNYGILTHFLSPATITLRDDSATNTIVVTNVAKSVTANIASYTTGVGVITTIQTATPHGLITNENVQFDSVSGTGCGGPTGFNSGVFQYAVTVIDATHFTIPLDTRAVCTNPSGGTTTSLTLFTAPAHGLSTGNLVKVSGATGDWAVWNQPGMYPIVLDASHFTEYPASSPNTLAYSTAFNGSITKFYPGGFGHTHRVSICAGSSCGASASTFESLVVHKIANGLSDTTLNTSALNPDPNWTGVQMCGAVSCSVYLGTRHAVLRSTMAAFSTTHNGTAQYLFAGLSAGTYAVTINGVGVSGSPFTVAASDNSIEFESTAGTVSINGSVSVLALNVSPPSLSYSCVSGGSNPSPQTVAVSATNGTLDNWSATKTQSWLTLSPSSGSAAGNITASVDCSSQSAGAYADTITVASATSGIANSPQTVSVALTVSPPPNVITAISGNTTQKGNVTIH